MHIPSYFRQENKADLVAFMKKYSFASLITGSNHRPVATHIPFVVEEEDEKIVLYSHLAKVNLQWQDFEKGEVLVVFQEPHAYISPTLYEKIQSVPTWNYIAVHAYGKAEMTDAQSTLVLEKMIAAYEPSYRAQWEGLPENYKTGMLKGIVSFRIEVTELLGSEKLSQNKTHGERQGIATRLEGAETEVERVIGKRMREQL
jgi:transcriptional regulator